MPLTSVPRTRLRSADRQIWLRDLMTAGSRIRYLLWRASPVRRSVTVKLRAGEKLVLRPPPAWDLALAREVFVTTPYESPRPLAVTSVHRIVDVGANVGYTVVYWLHHYPLARIEAFEPHPGFVRYFRENVKANGSSERVVIHAVAAGVRKGVAHLIDAETISRTTEREVENSIRVNVVDFYETVGDERIDLLKLDCEGAEYPLLMDRRFEKLNLDTLVLEWHAIPTKPNAEWEIRRRLESLGWELESIGPRTELPGLTTGLFWAYRSKPHCG